MRSQLFSVEIEFREWNDTNVVTNRFSVNDHKSFFSGDTNWISYRVGFAPDDRLTFACASFFNDFHYEV